MNLFDDFERTHDGPADMGESLYAYINRSARSQAAQARMLCERWFDDYKKSASTDDIKSFVGAFRSKVDKQHYAAWFELLMHQILIRLGCSVKIHPDLSGNDNHPDFNALSDGSRFFVEATVVAPDKDPFAPSYYEQDAQKKFTQLEIANFTMRVARVRGTLNRHLKNKEIKREFGRLVAEHDPDIVQRRIDEHGYGGVPSRVVRFGDWHLLIELWPLPPGKRTPRKARVAPWPLIKMHDASVPQAREKIRKKRRRYGPTAVPLILAVNVYNRGGFDPENDGHDALFAEGGIWSGQGSSRSTPAAVLFVGDTNSYAVPSTRACLFVNPSVDPDTIPRILLRLTHFRGRARSERIDGESVARIVALV